MADYGRVIAVNTHTVGDQVAGAHAAGMTVLQLDDSSDFPPEGGTVSTDLGLLDYAAVNADEDLMTLADSVPTGGLPDGARIELWDLDRGALATETIASVVLEGSEDDGDPFEATVRHSLRALLPDGIREGPGEVVEVDVEAEQVIDAPGRTPQLDGQAVWNPHSYRTFNGQTVAHATHEKLLGWSNSETDGITFTAGQWIVVSPAWYEMRAWTTWASNANGRRRVRILVNGVAVRVKAEVADPEIETYCEAFTEMRLFEGDVVEVWGYQSSGAGLAVTAGTFSIHRLSI